MARPRYVLYKHIHSLHTRGDRVASAATTMLFIGAVCMARRTKSPKSTTRAGRALELVLRLE